MAFQLGQLPSFDTMDALVPSSSLWCADILPLTCERAVHPSSLTDDTVSRQGEILESGPCHRERDEEEGSRCPS